MSGFTTIFGGDNTGFIRAVKEMEHAASHMGGHVKNEIRGMVGAYVGFEALKHTAEMVIHTAGEISRFSKTFEVNTDSVQKAKVALQKFGMELGDLGTIYKFLAGTREKAAESDNEMLKRFEKYGVTFADLENPAMSTYDILVKIGNAMKQMKFNHSMQSDFKALFGRAGAQMVNVVKEIAEEQDRATPLIGKESLESIHEAEIAMAELRRELVALMATPIGGALKSFVGFLGDKKPFRERTPMTLDGQAYENMKERGSESYLPFIYHARLTDEEKNTAGQMVNFNKYSGGKYEKEMTELWNKFYETVQEGTKEDQKKAYEAVIANMVRRDPLSAKLALSPLNQGIGARAVEESSPEHIKKVEEEAKTRKKAAEDAKYYDEESNYADMRAVKIQEAQAALQKTILDIATKRLEPAERIVELHRQANEHLKEAQKLEANVTSSDDLVKAAKEREAAARLNDEAYGLKNNGGGGGSRHDKMAIDEMAKNNLSVGIKAYEPMMNATTVNTTATISNTDALNKNGAMINSLLSTVTISAWD